MISPFHPDGLTWLLSIKNPVKVEATPYYDLEWAKESIPELVKLG